jgi:hypothetical protein
MKCKYCGNESKQEFCSDSCETDYKNDPSAEFAALALGKGEKLEVDYYIVVINPNDYDRWKAMINQGESLPPELIGMLIERARPKHIITKKE